MVYKVFLDTNIVIDVLQQGRPGHDSAKELFYHLSNNAFSAFYSESVVTTLVYVLRKDYTPEDFLVLLEQLNLNIGILPCTNALVQRTIARKAKDFEDALLYEIALENKMNYFITSNTKDFISFSQASLPVITSKEFIPNLRSPKIP